MSEKIKVGVLDDYQHVALSMADWSVLNDKAEITVFHDHLANESEIIDRLFPFEIICVMRERTPMTREILSKLTNLKLIVSTGMRNASIDITAAEELKIKIAHTGYVTSGAPEMTWALLMAIARNIPHENVNFRSGNWQTTIGTDLSGKTIGIIGLGRIGQKMAVYAKAFDMQVVAWSQNLTEEKARAAGARLVTKEELFRISDFVTIHLVLSERSKGIVKEAELALMKPTAYLINTSRGPLIDENALINALENKKIAGAALDVFDSEPLPEDHKLRTFNNILATPHIGYVTEYTYKVFYEDTVKAIQNWMNEN